MSSRYFGFVNGKPYDFLFKKTGRFSDPAYDFYLGDHLICTAIKTGYRAGWTCLVNHTDQPPETPTTVEGLVSRRACVDYALKVHAATRETYNENLRRLSDRAAMG